MQESNPVMTPEGRPIGTSDAGAAVATPGAPGGDALADPWALQILSTERWSLLATRSLAYNEAFSRASMFLSATLIVIGFLAASIGPGGTMALIVAILLSVDLFIGLATMGRLMDAGNEELEAVRGMNRIRNAYRQMVPGLQPYFVTGFHDDLSGVLATYGYELRPAPIMVRNILHGLTTTIGMVVTVVVVVFGTLLSVIALGIGVDVGPAVVLGLFAFFAGSATSSVVMGRMVMERQGRAMTRFPSPVAAPPPTDPRPTDPPLAAPPPNVVPPAARRPPTAVPPLDPPPSERS